MLRHQLLHAAQSGSNHPFKNDLTVTTASGSSARAGMALMQDLPEAITSVPGGLWDHFVMYGQHEGRPHQFLCGERQQLALERQQASKRAAMSLLRTQMPCSPLFGTGTGGLFAPRCNTTVAQL